jgi:hypothetical protein
MAAKATITDKAVVDPAAVSDSAGSDSADAATSVPDAVSDTAGSGDAGADTPSTKPEPAAPPAKATAGRASTKRAPKERVEEYVAHKPDGNGGYIEVTVRRNVDTGASEIVDG